MDELQALARFGSLRKAAQALGIPYTTFQNRVTKAREFQAEELPSNLPTVEELRARRRVEFTRVHEAKEARKLINVKVQLDGPIDIAHFGDPHIDDPGCNIELLERHIEVINRTEGLLAGNVGDQQNLWVGRLAKLYGQQSTSAAESWMLRNG